MQRENKILDAIETYNNSLAKASEDVAIASKTVKQTLDKFQHPDTDKMIDSFVDNITLPYQNLIDETFAKRNATLKALENEELNKVLDETSGAINNTKGFIKQVEDTIDIGASFVDKILDFVQGAEGNISRSTLNSDIKRLSKSGPDFSSNMFTVYLSNTSYLKSSDVTNPNIDDKTREVINEIFSFRCTGLNIPQSKAKLLAPFKTRSGQIVEKLSNKREGSHQSSLNLRLDDHLKWWYLGVNDLDYRTATPTGMELFDSAYQYVPRVFFPNNNNSYKEDAAKDILTVGTETDKHRNVGFQTLVVSLANLSASRLSKMLQEKEITKQTELKKFGFNKVSFGEDLISPFEYPEKSDYGLDSDIAFEMANTFPIYVFENVKFIGRPDLTLQRDGSNIVTGDFNFIFSRVTKKWCKFNITQD